MQNLKRKSLTLGFVTALFAGGIATAAPSSAVPAVMPTANMIPDSGGTGWDAMFLGDRSCTRPEWTRLRSHVRHFSRGVLQSQRNFGATWSMHQTDLGIMATQTSVSASLEVSRVTTATNLTCVR